MDKCVKVKKRKDGTKNFINSTDESINEVVTSAEPKEDTVLTKTLNSISRFIQGEELYDFLSKIKNVTSFDNFTLSYSKGHEGANQFIIYIIDSNNNKKVGKFVAFVYEDSETKKYSLQIQKVEIYPEYKGKGIMRKFYQEFNEWLKNNFDNFDKFTSDFIFLYNEETGNYDGFNMWEDLVKKGLARRLSTNDADYIPQKPDNKGMWKLNSGYALSEEMEVSEVKKSNESFANSKKSSIFVNSKNLINKKIQEMVDTTKMNTVKEPITLPQTPVKPSTRRKRIWESEPAHAPKPKM